MVNAPFICIIADDKKISSIQQENNTNQTKERPIIWERGPSNTK
jgi:hypothetical protein